MNYLIYLKIYRNYNACRFHADILTRMLFFVRFMKFCFCFSLILSRHLGIFKCMYPVYRINDDSYNTMPYGFVIFILILLRISPYMYMEVK